MNNQKKDDKPKMNVLNRFRQLRARTLAAAALLMSSGIGVRHPSEEEVREFTRIEPTFFYESANGSGNPPYPPDLREYYQLPITENTPIYLLDSAHAEKTKDGYKIVLFGADTKKCK